MNCYEKAIKLLINLNWRLACAESCTGGMLCSGFVDVAGASQAFEAGFVTYSVHSKSANLGVSEKIISNYGVVSEQVAAEMAKCAAMKTGANAAIAVTGFAGPDGGNGINPGTVCFGFYIDGTIISKTVFWGDIGRAAVRKKSCDFAAETLYDLLSLHVKTENK